MMSTRRLGILLGVLVLAAVLVVANAAAYSGSEGGYHVKLVVPQEHSDTSPEDSYNMTFIASTQTAGFLGTEGGYNLNLNLYTSGVGGAYNESGLRLYLVPKQAYISHWCDIPANDPICAELGIFACISGYKLNETGVGLAGWTINVTNITSGVEVGSNVTAATGFWQVCGLPAGTYTVCETPQNGWIAVDPADGCNESIELTNADITNVNFTNRGLCVSGYKLNETGVGLAGWTINVTNVTSGVEVGSNVTAATGFWQVCNLPAGTYTVCETLQNGWIAVDPVGGCNDSVMLTDADVTNVNFTNRGLCVSGYKLNETGVGLAGWTINVTNVTSGVEVGSNVTAATGFWQVCNLPAGTYTVCETPQNGWIAVDPADGCNESIELTNADITNVNFTNRECNGSISDFVWVDTNQNGVQDPGEPGIGNVTVNLYRHASPETLIGTKETDDNGYCIFDKLCPGNYSLQFILPPGYAFTQPNQGDDEQDSDVYPGTWSTAILSLGDGGIKTAIDAGLYQVGKPVPEPVPAFTPIGLIALVSLLLAIADVAIVRKRR